jgi:hypothetical protein
MSCGSNTEHFRSRLCLHHQSVHGVGFWNTCLVQPPDAAVSLRKYYYIVSVFKEWIFYSYQHHGLPTGTTVWFFFNLECIPYFLIVLFVWPILYVHLTLLGSLVIIFQLPNGEDSLEEANKSKVVRQLFSIWGLVPQHTRLLYHYLTIVHFILNSSPS